jgi:hypothetical protein
MFARYGRHLEETWEVKPMFPSFTKPEPLPEAIAPSAPDDYFKFDESLTGL